MSITGERRTSPVLPRSRTCSDYATTDGSTSREAVALCATSLRTSCRVRGANRRSAQRSRVNGLEFAVFLPMQSAQRVHHGWVVPRAGVFADIPYRIHG